MALYRIYVDEVGTHDLTHADDPNQRFLSLTGVVLESEYTIRVLQPEIDQIKRDFFQRDPDEPVIFHRKELVNKRPPFHPLRDPESEQKFNTALLAALARWEYRVIKGTAKSCCRDKKRETPLRALSRWPTAIHLH